MNGKDASRPATTDPTDLLEAAADRVVAGAGGPLALPDDASLRRQVDELVAWLRSAWSGAEDVKTSSGIYDAPSLLRELRTEVLAAWPEDHPLLPTMRAFEVVQKRLLDQAGGGPQVPPARLVLRELAHMIRSPLGSIVMLAETLGDPDVELPPERRHSALATIYNAALGLLANAADLTTMLDDDLEGPGAIEEFSPDEALEAVADVVRPVAHVRGCDIVVLGPGEARLTGPASRIRRALLELALRVARRTRDGTVKLGAARGRAGRLTFFVEANGSGAAPELGFGEILEVFRPDAETEKGFTVSAEALSVSAAGRLIRSMGSELEMDREGDDHLRFSFSLA